MKPHKHAELIKAWADGAEIEYLDGDIWMRTSDPSWSIHCVYRIKPEPKPDVIAVGIIKLSDKFKPEMAKLASYKTEFCISERWEKDNVRFTFDGETGKLKKAEVL